MKKVISIVTSLCLLSSSMLLPVGFVGNKIQVKAADSTETTTTDEAVNNDLLKAYELVSQLLTEKQEENNSAFDGTDVSILDNKCLRLVGMAPSYEAEVMYYVNNTLKENNLSNVEILSLWRTIALEEPNDYKFVPPTAESATTTAEAETEDAEVKITAKAGNASIVLSQADVNTDGSVDAKDATVVLSDYAQSIASNATVLTPEIADANDDGVIDSKDATLILVYYADEISSK